MLDDRDNINFPSVQGGNVSKVRLKLDKFLKYIESKEVCVYISTITLGEFLQKIDKDKRSSYIKIIKNNSKFTILSFDELAAYEMADLPLSREIKNGIAQSEPSKTAAALKLDRQIVAISIAYHIDEVWTQDKGMIRLLNYCKTLDHLAPNPKSFDDILEE